jgi:acyl transferase domain-containing protein/acyl carrier protein
LNKTSVFDYNDAPEIAIIAMAGRFPGARNIEMFWQNLRDGVESITFFSEQELVAAGIDPELLRNPKYVKAKGVLEDVERFDASFFGFSPREAEIMDPQQRLFLECAWEALEQAGYNPETYPGHIGVYAGASMSSYAFNIYFNQNLLESVGSFQTMLGNDKDYLTTRVSYKLNLKGPSINVNTACSTSLVAVHLACQSLLNGECDIALAGGASISVPQKDGYVYQEEGILSPDGHCRAFDARAQGTVGGDGVGIVALKRLADAIADGDQVYSVIKASAINNDGALKVGYTAPSVEGQAEVIAEALAMAEVDPEAITYIETHGTGTPLGDPIEIAALTQVFRASTEAKGFCAIGSVKTNVGHLNTAAGVAGLIKAALALEHKCIPPSLHFEQPNPKIDFVNSPFYVNTALSEWKVDRAPRRAGVSSFGIGGTNAHVVLEEAPFIEASGPSRAIQLLMLSAKTSPALETVTAHLAKHFKQHPDLNLADAAYTLHVGRRAFDYRRTVVCRDLDDAISALETLDPGRVSTADQRPRERPAVFMFPGQGTQYVNMALQLYQANSIFREQIDSCSDLLEPHLGLDLRKILYPSEEQAAEAAQQLNQTVITQPALFAVEYALARLWMEWGVYPQAMVGHSIGEYVAACLAGVFSLQDALSLVALRGRMIQELPCGAMLSVPLSENDVYPLLGKKLSLAAINGPSLCVISGPTEAIDALQHQLTQQGVDSRRLPTSHAFHSVMMEPILELFAEQVSKVNLKPPKIPYISNVTGTWITGAEAVDPIHWAKHIRQTVRFAEGVHEILKEPDRILLEVGPGQTLSSLARQHGKGTEQTIFPSLRHPHDRHSDVAFLLNTLGRLWLTGIRIDQSKFYAGERRRRIPLPTYPFERQPYWVERQSPSPDASARRVLSHKRPDIVDWFYIPVWKQSAQAVPRATEEQLDQKSCWLVFIDACGVGSQMEKRLKQEGHDVVAVIEGKEFTRLNDGTYTINPRRLDDYDALLSELRLLGKTLQRVVHLWNVTPSDQMQSGADFLETHQHMGFYSLLFLAQALGNQNTTASLQIGVVSNNMQDVTGEEALCPEKAILLGPCKVLPQEYPNITCRSIDIVVPQSGTWQEEKLIGQLIAELTAKPPDSVIAYRGKHRWVQGFEPVRLDGRVEALTRLRKGGVYLITGGLGGIGLVLAEHLAKNACAKLVLVGRSAFPGRDEWERWLATHSPEDEVSRKIRKLQGLEDLGAEILAVSADIASQEQMQEVIARTRKRFGEIHGVIHAAGVAGGGIIQLKTPKVAASVLAPKLIGTLVLDAVLKGVKLDFFVLCSSLSSIIGGAGQVDYCAANAFLDAFAHRNMSKDSTFTVSINWPTWKEVGMAVNTAVPPDLRAERDEDLKRGIQSEEGADAFSRILRSELPQVVVSPQDLHFWIGQNNGFTASSPLEKRGKEHLSKPTHPRPKLASAYSAPRNEVEQTVADIWQELLGIEQVGIYDSFFELGGHSLLAIRLMSRLRDAFRVELSLRNLIEAPVVAELALVIEKMLIMSQQTSAAPQSPLVGIQPTGSKRPFFCIHPQGGGVLCYYDLARYIGSDQPFYGLQDPSLEGEQGPYARIEDMAAHYIEAMRAFQPQGPYLLGGWPLRWPINCKIRAMRWRRLF